VAVGNLLSIYVTRNGIILVSFMVQNNSLRLFSYFTKKMYIFIMKVAVFVVPFLATLKLCQTNWEEIRPTFVTGKFVTTSHTTLGPYSQMQCVDRCFREARKGRCNMAGYNKTAQSCHLSTGNYEHIIDVADGSSGVFLVQIEPTGKCY